MLVSFSLVTDADPSDVLDLAQELAKDLVKDIRVCYGNSAVCDEDTVTVETK